MKKCSLLLAILVLIIALSPVIAFASDALWRGEIRITNSGNSTGNVTATVNISSEGLVENNFAAADLSDIAVQYNGSDIPFQPSVNSSYPWCFFVDDIGADQNLAYDFYSGNASGGKIRYFPGSDGMTSDNFSIGDNFTIEQKGWIDTSYSTPPFSQVLIGGFNNALSQIAPEFNCLQGGGAWTATENAIWQVIPTNGAISSLIVRLSAPVAAGSHSFTFTLWVDSTTTSLSVTINTGESTGSDITHSVVVTAGQTVSLRSTYTGAPGTPTAAWSTMWNSDIANESINLVNILSTSAATTYGVIQGSEVATVAIETAVQAPIPTAGTFKKLYIKLSTVPGLTPDAYTITLRKAAANTDLTVTIPYTNTTGSDITHTVAANAGDLFNWAVVPVSAPANSPYCAIGMVFVSGTAGESLIIGGDSYDMGTAATQYEGISGAMRQQWTNTEANVYQLTQYSTLRNLYVSLDTAPGAGNSYQFQVREITANTGITVTISGTATSGSDTTHIYNSSNGDVIDMSQTPDSSPAASKAHWGLVSLSMGSLFLVDKPQAFFTYVFGDDIVSFIAGSVSVTASDISSGEHTVKTTYDGATLKIFVDDMVNPKDTEAWAGSVPDNASDWNFLQNYSMPYMEYHKIWINGVLQQHIIWQYGTTFQDQSAGNHDATPTFRTEGSANIGATLVGFEPITEAKVSTFTLGDTYEILTANATAPENLYDDSDFSKLPASPINEILDESSVPRAAWWFPFLFFGICVVGFIVYGATTMLRGPTGKLSEGQIDGSLLLMFIVMEAALVALGKMGPLPLWCAYLFVIPGLALILSRKHYAWG